MGDKRTIKVQRDADTVNFMAEDDDRDRFEEADNGMREEKVNSKPSPSYTRQGCGPSALPCCVKSAFSPNQT